MYFCGRDKRKHSSLSWRGETCSLPSKSKSTLDWDASQSPLSLVKLDPFKAELDLNPHTTLKMSVGVADTSTDEHSDARSLFRRDFTRAWSQKGVSELLRGHDESLTGPVLLLWRENSWPVSEPSARRASFWPTCGCEEKPNVPFPPLISLNSALLS